MNRIGATLALPPQPAPFGYEAGSRLVGLIANEPCYLALRAAAQRARCAAAMRSRASGLN
jgi:hypothetical protein